MRRRSFFFLGAGAAAVGIAGCNGTAEQSSGGVTVPYLEVENYETSAATVTVLLTDTNRNVHRRKTVDLDASGGFCTGEGGNASGGAVARSPGGDRRPVAVRPSPSAHFEAGHCSSSIWYSMPPSMATMR